MFWAVAWGLRAVAFAAASWTVNRLTRKDVKAPDPSGRDDVQAPTVEEGRSITVFWGDCKLSAPNVIWYGNLYSTLRPSGAYEYYLAMIWAWCFGPVDAILALLWDDKPVSSLLPESTGGALIPLPLVCGTSPDEFWIFERGLFGGVSKEGGIYGHYAIHWGTDDQEPDQLLQACAGTNEHLPAYRGLCYTCAEHRDGVQFYQGMSPYLKPHSMVARRNPNGLGLGSWAANLDGGANAANMIYELLTDTTWGLGLPATLIDTDAFLRVALSLGDEDFGLSLQQTSDTDARVIINEILRHIDGVLYPDRATGLYSLSLIRDDYQPEYLVELDDDAILELESFSRPSMEGLANKVLLKYIDRDQEYQEKIAITVDLAGVTARGRVIPQDMSFLGINNAARAQKVAARELKAIAYPFAGLAFKANRKAWSLRPGSPFKFTFSPLGISGMVCRVTRISFGAITDGKIRIEAVEDAFGVDGTAFSPPPPSGWVYPL